ncbi:MAG: hypothetical protein AAF432_00605 [Planctomycetota bacterium]
MADAVLIRNDLKTDREVLEITERLELERADFAVGLLSSAWTWICERGTIDEAADGHATIQGSKRLLDLAVGFPGLADAMEAAGWLQVDGDTLVFPKAGRWIGDGALSRMRERSKKRRSRRKSGDSCPRDSARHADETGDTCPQECAEEDESGGQVSPQNGQISALQGDRCALSEGGLGGSSSPDSATETKRGKKKNRRGRVCEAEKVWSEFGELDTPECRDAWDRWLTFRRESKLRLPAAVTQRSKFNEFVAWGGPPAMLASIEQSIGNGWAGLFDPKSKSSRGSSTPKHQQHEMGRTDSEIRRI